MRGGRPGHVDLDHGHEIVDVCREIALERDVTVAQVALNYLLCKPGITSLIVGARTREQLADNLAAASWDLSAAEVARLDAVSERPLPYPYWHQRQFNERMP